VTELEGESKAHALVLQREIQEKRAQVVADIDELRDVVRIRLSLAHILQSHPRVMQGAAFALGIGGIATLVMIFRATKRSKQR
jgi:hypothetical protein